MADASYENVDPRIRRTRQLLQQALEKLLEIKDFDQISIQDIAAEATVNRATFYDHYNDKSALLATMVGCQFHQLLCERQVQFDGSCAGALKALVLAVAEYLMRIQGPERARAIQPHMESAIISAIRHILLEGVQKHPPKDVPAELVAAAASWATYGAVKEWAATKDRIPAEELASTVMGLVAPVLQVPVMRATEPALLDS